MERTEFKWLAGALGTVMVVMLFLFSSAWRSPSSRNPLEDWLTVSMPRPIKEMILGFSLSGRNIKRELELVAQAKKTADNKNAKKNDSGTKAAVDKGSAKKTAQQKAQAEARRRQELAFRARIIEESERYRRRLLQAQYNQAEEQNYARAQQANTTKNANTNQTEKEKEEEKMDAAAWKSLVLAQPTVENVQKMIQAFQSGELEAQAYYEIVESLVKDNSEDKRKMGLWALTSSVHVKGFTLASHLVSEVDSTSQQKLNDYLYSYNNTRSLTVLDQVLRSSDAVATAAAASVISQAIDKLKAGQSVASQDVRAGRTQSQSQTLTLDSYQKLIPTLQWLITKTGSTLSQWAQNLLSQLRSNTSPA